MILNNDKKDIFSQKTEIKIKKQAEIQKVFKNRIYPHRNHTLWQFNLKTKELTKAIFDKKPYINWEDAVSKNYSAKKKEITIKDDCIYFTSLNRENAIKILKRDFNIYL